MTEHQQQHQNCKVDASPQDFFLHILSIIALYISAASFLAIVFQTANIVLYDPLDQSSVLHFYDKMRISIASMVVVFPIYVVAMAHLQREYRIRVGIRAMKIRSWLVAFTLFVASLIIIGDTVALVQNFLSGEIKARFLVKACAVFFVAASIMTYYIWDAKRWRVEEAGIDAGRGNAFRMFSAAILSIVMAAAVGGFFMVGSPANERSRRFDERRVSDLQAIQSELINYWQGKGKLPAKLSELTDATRGVFIPRDPSSEDEYVYVQKGNESFELCAVFERESSAQRTPRFVPEKPMFVGDSFSNRSWIHGAGRVCFDRTIDKDFFKPAKEIRPRSGLPTSMQ